MLKNLLLHFKTLADYLSKRDDKTNYGIPYDSITFVDESRRINTFDTDYYCGTSQLGSMAYKSSLQFSEVTSKPTSLSGYGITDGVNDVSVSGSGNAVTSASVSGHTLTLTKGTTFLTSHQAVSNKSATLSWGAAVTIATIGNTNINVSLPANPNTDTKNTAGSTDTSNKIFLIGAMSQAANPQTYSHDTAYVGTDGCLYSGGTKVSVSGHTHSYLPLSGGALTGSVSLKESCNILLRPNLSSYISGIGYDTSGNECVAIWAKNSVTRLRWHAGVDMSTLSSGTMMGITPDFEISKASGSAIGYIAGNTILHSGNYNSYAPTKTGGGASGTWGISITGNAASATSSTKATQDSAGQQINTTYIKSLSVSGTTITYTKGDGTTGTITTQDTNTDTKNTAGTTNLTATKLYLAGATSQAANPQTYSNTNVYIGTDNCLYSGGAKVLTAHQSLANYVNTVSVTGTGNVVSAVSKSGSTITVTKGVTALTAHQTIYDLTIQGNGTTIGTFDPNGAAKTINITPANIGAAASGHTHSYLPLSGGTLTGNLTCNKDLFSNYLKSLDGTSNIYIGDLDNSAYVTFVEDMQGSDDNGDGTWFITNSGGATFNDITTDTMKVQTSLDAEKIVTDNIKTSASGLKVQKSDYVTSGVQIGPSGTIELYASTPLIDFHYNNSTADYSTRIVCDTSTRLSVLATTFRASNAITCVSLTQTSDERLKENIKDVDDEFVDNLFATDNGYIHQFDFKDSKRHSNGIIAQEVKDIMPEVVDYDETDDVYRVDYTSASMKLIGAMFKKMKQMQEEIDILKSQNNKN